MVTGLAAEERDISGVPLLKWMGPGKPGTFKDYKKEMDFSPLEVTAVDMGTRGDPNVLILVKSTISTTLDDEIARYADDIEAYHSITTETYRLSYGTPEQIKDFIIDHDDNLQGVVFVGYIPAAWYEIANDFGSYGYASFPCDLFYMDLDGTWTDSDSDDKYDGHSGDTAPEIFVARIDAYRVGSETTKLDAYFDKLHTYYNGDYIMVEYGLTYTNNDWVPYSYFLTDIQYLYGSNNYEYEAGCPPRYPSGTVTGDNYEDYILPDLDYGFVQLSCHSSATTHYFDCGESINYSEVYNAPPGALGYNLFCCSSNRFTSSNFLGGNYIFNNGKAMAVIGSSKTGSMLEFDKFYTPLGQDKCMGEAFKIWFQDVAPYTSTEISWYYGMCIVGDPMIDFLE